jgi:hypothetical protein
VCQLLLIDVSSIFPSRDALRSIVSLIENVIISLPQITVINTAITHSTRQRERERETDRETERGKSYLKPYQCQYHLYEVIESSV